MNKYIFLIFFAFIIIASFSSCSKLQAYEPHEEEVITTLLLKIIPQSGGSASTFIFEDADGPGGMPPTIDPIFLQANSSYDVEVILLNKTTNPVDTISHEVEEEAVAHRIYHEPALGATLQVTDADADENGIPIGLKSVWETGAASTGKIDITLRHYPGTPPNKAAVDLVNSSKSTTDLTTKDVGGFVLTIQ